MTPRQQRRLQQKLARKAEKKLNSAKDAGARPDARERNPLFPSAQPICGVVRDPKWAPAVLRGFPESQTVPVSASVANSSGFTTDRKLAANRANTQFSTGPVSAAGKQTVSQNASRHGLTGKFQVLPDESQAGFDQLLAEYMRDEVPLDQAEIQFVQQMAEATWLSRRSLRFQDKCFVAIQSGTPEEQQQAKKDLALYLRYMTTHDRAYARYATELRKHRNERRRAERGFVSQKQRAAQELRREAQEIRKKELHEVRHAIQTCRRERMQSQNRVAAAKAEHLEMQNRTNEEVKTLAAVA
jgi:hypothetical protein